MVRDSHTAGSGANQGGTPALGDALRALRLAGGVSQEGWAARLGVGRRTVVRWEQGETVPDAAMAETIIAACQERALFLRAALTPELLHELLARARLARPGPANVSPPPADSRVLGNLPAPLTSFIGRVAELEDVARLLGTTRLLTLTGAGGCGKTRLALELARRHEGRFADGAWLVELASISDAEAVAAATAAALGVREEPGRSIQETVTESLRPRSLLLVLDNAEHLREACASLATALLRACHQLTVLVTSRIALGMLGETVWRVPSLAMPDPAQASDLETLGGFPSVRLFTERAGAVRSGFALTGANAAAITLICHRLDGIPLAIELAAARMASLSAEQIAARLDDRYALLTEGNRGALPRHRTLHALIDWSYSLLTSDEQRLFAALSVFAGGFTLDAVEAVHGDGATLDLLSSLVAHSLVLAEESGGVMRYRMLETLRSFAAERLAAHGEPESAGRRHCEYYHRLSEEALSALTGPAQAVWLHRLADEHDNFRAALRWCEAHRDQLATGLRIATHLNRFWEARGHLTEGREWFRRLLAHADACPPGVRAPALNAAGNLARTQGDIDASARFYEQSLALARELGDEARIATTLTNLGLTHMDAGEDDRAHELFTEGLALRRQLGNQRLIANSLHNLGYLARRRGDLATARALYEECLGILRAAHDATGTAFVLDNLGMLACRQQEFERARSLFTESLEIRRATGDERGMPAALYGMGRVACALGEFGPGRARFAEGVAIAARLGMQASIAECLEGMAAALAGTGECAHGAYLLGHAEALRTATRSARRPSDTEHHAQLTARLRDSLGPAGWEAAFTAGQGATTETVIARVAGTGDGRRVRG